MDENKIPREPEQPDIDALVDAELERILQDICADTPAPPTDVPAAEAPQNTPEAVQPASDDLDEKWLEEFLNTPETVQEIQPDDHAMDSVGLTHPSDLEFERIMREARSENWGAEDTAEQPDTSDDDVKIAGAEPPAPQSEFRDDEFRDTFGEGEILDQVFSDQPITQTEAEEPVTKTAKEKQPLEKVRPARKKGYGLFGLPHLAATAIWLIIIIAIGVAAGRLVWLCASDVLAFGREPISATVTISETDTIDDIASKLQDAGLIKYPSLFKIYADLTDAAEEIIPGTYQFSQTSDDNERIVYDYMAIKSVMSPHSSSLVIVEDLRIPEGYTCAQIFQLLEEKKVCTVAELEAYAANGELDEYWFLEGVARGDKYCLEGYLFPDTYDFYENDDPERVLEKMLDAFNANFTTIMRDKLQKLDGYTIREVVIIASMIEKETANPLESFTVSSVIHNRLKKPYEFPYLNIDATIVYALGGKTDLTEEDLKIDHPYNTYTNKGLPPGPISNPSQNSLAAALDPESTNYYYYAFDPSTKEHHFSKTYKEHQDFLATLEDEE